MRFVLFPVLVLSACSSLVPATVMKLGGLSPLTADPADFAVNLSLPNGVDLRPNTARLVFSVTRSDTQHTEEGIFTLQRAGSVFTIHQSDHDDLRALQSVAKEWNAENPDTTQGALSVSLSPCRIGTGPEPDATVSVAVQVEQGGPFLPLVKGGPLSVVTSEAQLREMPDCP
ncbi:hypothetical protein [Yoonia sp. BS5-3]|uniref:Lipoprotein n=1 Tax=Yoonia phaeophyticola TaxID=3137369 RepID=A0ABZ2V6B9_9RHOB